MYTQDALDADPSWAAIKTTKEGNRMADSNPKGGTKAADQMAHSLRAVARSRVLLTEYVIALTKLLDAEDKAGVTGGDDGDGGFHHVFTLRGRRVDAVRVRRAVGGAGVLRG